MGDGWGGGNLRVSGGSMSPCPYPCPSLRPPTASYRGPVMGINIQHMVRQVMREMMGVGGCAVERKGETDKKRYQVTGSTTETETQRGYNQTLQKGDHSKNLYKVKGRELPLR